MWYSAAIYPDAGLCLIWEEKVPGISVSHDAILNTKGVELQWETYWEEKRQIVCNAVLWNFKRHQEESKSTHIYAWSVVEHSEVQPIAGAELPPQLYMIEPPAGLLRKAYNNPFGILCKSNLSRRAITSLPFHSRQMISKPNWKKISQSWCLTRARTLRTHGADRCSQLWKRALLSLARRTRFGQRGCCMRLIRFYVRKHLLLQDLDLRFDRPGDWILVNMRWISSSV